MLVISIGVIENRARVSPLQEDYKDQLRKGILHFELAGFTLQNTSIANKGGRKLLSALPGIQDGAGPASVVYYCSFNGNTPKRTKRGACHVHR